MLDKLTIILVQPQMAENIGAVARAMMNCGVTDLRLVAPRDGWPQQAAYPMASGADEILNAAQIFPDLASALGDVAFALATGAADRDMVLDIYDPVGAVAQLQPYWCNQQRAALVFGPERTGLVNDDVVLCNGYVQIPLNPAFTSLNLSQAVLLLCYQAWAAEQQPPQHHLQTGSSPLANKSELLNFLEHFEQALDAGGFFASPKQRPVMRRNFYNFFGRARPTQQEIRTAHGMLVALSGLKKQKNS